MAEQSQFKLLAQRRFLPFFGAQALGAFNDNVYKNTLVILATYQAASYTQLEPSLLTNIAAGLFILPFVLFSGMAGQLADRYDKARVLKFVKAAEIAIMAIAGFGFATHSIEVLLGALFLMGMHSTFFAPAKYGLLPDVLRDSELVGGNAMVEMGTFVAIVLGTLVAGLLAAHGGIALIVTTLMAIALLGFLSSLAIPKLQPAAPTLKIDWRPWTLTWENLRAARESRTVFLSILGISWFWFYGAVVLAQLPLYTKDVLGGSEEVVTVLLVMFSAGVGIGSLLCERLSGRQVEIGLVPFGSIGLTVFAVDLYLATPAMAGNNLSARDFIHAPGTWRVLMDMALIGLFGGLFIVPLYAMVQQRTRREIMSRVIGANSILNAVFMVVAAGVAALALHFGLTIPQLLLLTGVLNAFVALYIYSLVPEFLLRFIAWLLIHFVYRLDRRGVDNIPETGPALLICNHVGFADAIVIGGVSAADSFHHGKQHLQDPRAEHDLPRHESDSGGSAEGRSGSLRAGVPAGRCRAARWQSGLYLSRRPAHPRWRDRRVPRRHDAHPERHTGARRAAVAVRAVGFDVLAQVQTSVETLAAPIPGEDHLEGRRAGAGRAG